MSRSVLFVCSSLSNRSIAGVCCVIKRTRRAICIEVAVDTAESSLALVQGEMAKVGELNNQLQADLQRAEAYTDELRGKLSRMNLIVEALKNAEELEGKMNGATAKLWRGFMDDSGNANDYPLPEWLQRETRDGSESSDTSTEDSDTNSSETETAPAS